MALIEEALTEILTKNSAVSALVGSRIYPCDLPQNCVFPAINYHRISSVRELLMDGYINIAKTRFQVDCWDIKHLDVKRLGATIRKALNGFKGIVQGIDIQLIELDSDHDIPDGGEVEQIGLQSKKGFSQDFFIYFIEE